MDIKHSNEPRISARRDGGAIVRVKRRRHRSDEEKLAILKETMQPGVIMAVLKISEFFAIELDIKGAPPDERRRVRQQPGRSKLAVLRLRLEPQRGVYGETSNSKRFSFAVSDQLR